MRNKKNPNKFVFWQRKSTSMNNLKKVLKEKRIKQKWLAERLGKSENTLTNWVQGKTNISVNDLYKISEILDCPVTQLLEK